MDVGVSVRGAEKVLALFKSPTSQSSPSFSSIRNWFGRVGLYELNRTKGYRPDWIFIVDFTVEFGKQKAFVILGISQQQFVEQVVAQGRGLRHQDVTVLGLELLSSTKGERIQAILEQVGQRVGHPIQIVADHSSDLARGIKLYQQAHPALLYSHDVTHAMALLLKEHLQGDERYQSFVQRCTLTRQRLQQTDWAFLAPPVQRSQCRYFNVERLSDWALQVLNAPSDTLMALMPHLEPAQIQQTLAAQLGWLCTYEPDLKRWQQMTALTRGLETQLKQQGLSAQSRETFERHPWNPTAPALESFHQQMVTYLETQSASIPEKQTVLASSDVIESLFGKYKHFSTRCPLKDWGQMLLSLCLSTMTLTPKTIKAALETVPFATLKAWLLETLGQSIQSKRKTLFSAQFDDMEVV